MKKIFTTGMLACAAACQAFACTNFIVTRGASKSGSCLVSYSADSHVLYGELYHYPAATHEKGAMRKVYEWDSKKFLGEIPEAETTYNVVGNMNEHALAIGETTFGGRHELQDTLGLLDYGSLIYITLQRAKTAREAIKIIASLVESYGYCSEGESFSIADPNEAWIFEMVGKSSREVKNAKGKPFAKGAVWVAVRIPDGYVSGHANQARIQTFPLADGKKSITAKQMSKNFPPTAEVVYADDVVEFARACGYFSGADKDFSFSDTYNPVDFGGARFCDARVWSFFKDVNDEMQPYLDYAMGHNLKHRMPLYVKPNRRLGAEDIAAAMRDHYEGTPMDMRTDVGAGAYACPYRWRPMSWELDSAKYIHERATATQQTGFWFVAESRAPRTGGILWFGVDDAATSCLTPIFSCSTKVPECFAVGNGDMLTYSPTAAFWLFNRVTNFAYSRYDIVSADIIKVQREFEAQSAQIVNKAIAQAQELADPNLQVAMLTEVSANCATTLMQRWQWLDGYLLVKYIDGNIKREKSGAFGTFERTPHGACPAPLQPQLPEKFRRMIVNDNGETLKEWTEWK
ncbi:MAG: C69 family dipeptidase [Prevotellaceae bacterium]|jgi:dipeptidase|nr:C69 family dipeptidase [Prevotellaceae bacterium]